jgi:DNA-directed RNA polymerase subunit alpha
MYPPKPRIIIEKIKSRDEIFFVEIEWEKFSIRSRSVLRAEGIFLIGMACLKTENELSKFMNYGRKSIRELKNYLSDIGLSLGMPLSLFLTKEIIYQNSLIKYVPNL